MLKSTFLCVPGIGQKIEEFLWSRGILNWDTFKKKAKVKGLSENKRKLIEEYLHKIEKEYYEHRTSFLANDLPSNEYWRVYKDFIDKTIFLDIETTGLSLYYDKITVIGTYDGKEVKVFIKDNNLEEIIDYIKDFEIIVTFNGKIFDVPFIQKELPDIVIPPIHIDLRYLLRNLGYKGPLKKIEKKLNISRPDNLLDISGRDAISFWNKFLRGDSKSLEILVLYNIYDVLNLKSIMDLCYIKKLSKLQLGLLKNKKENILYYLDNNKFKNWNNQFTKIFNNEIDFLKKKYNLFNPKLKTFERKSGIIETYLNDNLLYRVNPKKIKRIEIDFNLVIDKIKEKFGSCISVGIDLTGSEKKSSGFCIINEKKAILKTINTDDDLISSTIEANPTIISIDSPLGLPNGRCCADDSCDCRRFGILRECERTLKRRGINVYPCLIKSMQNLTLRGIKLSGIFRKKGLNVIESYPGAAQDILCIPRKRIDLEELQIELNNLGIEIISENEKISHDELDAFTSALVGYFYLADFYEALGNSEEEHLIIPELKNIV